MALLSLKGWFPVPSPACRNSFHNCLDKNTAFLSKVLLLCPNTLPHADTSRPRWRLKKERRAAPTMAGPVLVFSPELSAVIRGEVITAANSVLAHTELPREDDLSQRQMFN